MDCNRIFEWIQARLDGQITTEENAQLQAHLESCASCRQLWEFYRQLDGTVASLAQEPPERMAQGIMYQISPDYVAKKTGRRPHKFHFAGTAIAAVAAAVLLLVGVGKLQTPRKESTAAEPQAYTGAEMTGTVTGEEDAFAPLDGTDSMLYDNLGKRNTLGQVDEPLLAEMELPTLVLYNVQPTEAEDWEPVWVETDVTDLLDFLAAYHLPTEQLPEHDASGTPGYTIYCYQLDLSVLSALAADNAITMESNDAEQGLLYLILPQ